MAFRDLYSQGFLEITGGSLGTVWTFLPVAAGVQDGHCSQAEPFSVRLARPALWFCVSQARPPLFCSWPLLSPAVCRPWVPRAGSRPDCWWGTHMGVILLCGFVGQVWGLGGTPAVATSLAWCEQSLGRLSGRKGISSRKEGNLWPGVEGC